MRAVVAPLGSTTGSPNAAPAVPAVVRPKFQHCVPVPSKLSGPDDFFQSLLDRQPKRVPGSPKPKILLPPRRDGPLPPAVFSNTGVFTRLVENRRQRMNCVLRSVNLGFRICHWDLEGHTEGYQYERGNLFP